MHCCQDILVNFVILEQYLVFFVEFAVDIPTGFDRYVYDIGVE